jgi:hypothetical protein
MRTSRLNGAPLEERSINSRLGGAVSTLHFITVTSKTPKKKAPWRCPKCGREFAQRSAYHGCGNYTVEALLEGKNPVAVQLFQHLVKTAQQLGPISLSPAKTQVSFRVQRTALMVQVSGRQLTGYLFLNRPAPAPFFRKVVAASANRHVHLFKISDAAIIDGPFKPLLAEAIAFASDLPLAKSPIAKESDQPPIGEQINALYRLAKNLDSAAVVRLD